MRKYPNPAYINYLTTFKNMGVPMPDGKWWGHRREKAPGKKYIDSRVFNMTLRKVFILIIQLSRWISTNSLLSLSDWLSNMERYSID